MSDNRVEIDENKLEKISGGSFQCDFNADGSVTITGDYTGKSMVLSAVQYLDLMNFSKTINDDKAGEEAVFARYGK